MKLGVRPNLVGILHQDLIPWLEALPFGLLCLVVVLFISLPVLQINLGSFEPHGLQVGQHLGVLLVQGDSLLEVEERHVCLHAVDQGEGCCPCGLRN